ncbi:hypothetical protein ACQV2B_23110, partial [Pantoea allii]|uniref:hypothetical protein n=2 Tax=Erwiniaceae TaxID=1903409 RepID=UPI003D31F368
MQNLKSHCGLTLSAKMLYNPEFSSAENTTTIHLHSLKIYFVVLPFLKSFHSRTVIANVPQGPACPPRRTVINSTPRARALPAVQLLTALPEGAVAPLNVNGALAFSHVCQPSH